MTALMMKTPETTMQEWKTVFPDFMTLEGSCTFIKKLVAVSLSAITYIRGIFPEDAYGERSLYGLRLKILTEDSGLKSVSKFINLIRGCYDAVEKKYLQQLSVGICQNKENRNEVIEAYNLVFSYKNDECSLTCQDKTNTFSPKLTDPTVQATLMMLKHVTDISKILKKLPKNAFLSVKLLYYDDVTPDDYEPPGFEPSTQVKFSFPRDTLNIKLGKIDTEAHGYKFLLKTTMHKQIMPQNDSEEPISLNTLEENAYAKETIHDDVSKEELFESQHSSQESLIRQLSKDMKTISGLKCPCKSKMAGHNDTIVCTSCEWLQHKVCYGILMPDDAPHIFYCTDCIIHNTDEDIFQELIYTYQGKECQEFCAIRRAINLCLSTKTVTHAMFEKILGYSKTMAKILIQRLEFEGFIRQISNTEKYAVESTNLMNYGLPNYFPETNRKNDQVLMLEDSEFQSNSKYTNGLINVAEYPGMSSPLQMSSLESSIKKVKTLSLTSKSPNQENIQNARKRKVSRKILSNELESEDAFPSQKRRRSTRKSLVTAD